MKKIQINLPYNNWTNEFEIWANEEESIDFRKDMFRASRCTISFGVCELIKYLNLLRFEVSLSDIDADYKI